MNDAESEYEEYSDSYDSDEDMKAVQEYAYLQNIFISRKELKGTPINCSSWSD